MSTEHTLGPWIIENDPTRDARGHWIHTSSSKTDFVAMVCKREGPEGRSEETANARLIHAAPALLAALKALVAIDAIRDGEWLPGEAKALDDADTAIAKATQP